MIDRRKRLLFFLVMILILILLALLLLWRLFRKPNAVETTEPVLQEQVINLPTSDPQVSVIVEQQREDRIATASLNVLAKTFAERYGSYSNEANFQNLRDVLPLMSEAFAQATEAMIDTSVAPTTHYGITTRVVSVKTIETDEEAGTATLELATQREESKDTPGNVQVWYQTIRLTFVTENGTWNVDSATWL